MVALILAICVPVTAFVTGYFTLKGVKVGLGTEEPKIIHKEADEEEEQEEPQENTELASMLSEWINGAEKKEG
ncbi:hypothetical protein [Ornithinibacillus xuwenensis]|uniref:Uncharacterized protein n=1 Tax=Ornithinibacillus xuwenensis TaxID=3144668 RepID=A0ABU9XF37_9BACI